MKWDSDKKSPERKAVTRREFMQISGVTTLGAVLPWTVTDAVAADIADSIRWMEFAHLQKPYFTKPFEEKTGIELIEGTVQNDDRTLSMLKAGGVRNWDIYHMGDLKNHPILARDDLCQAIDLDQIPNAKKILPFFREFIEENMSGSDGRIYAIPSRWGVDTIGYHTEKVEEPDSVKILWDKKYKGKIAMPDYALYEIVYAAQYLGYSDWYRLTSEQLQECKKVLIDQKPLLAGYWASDADVIEMWSGGEIWFAGASWAGTVSTLREQGIPVARTVPKEGAPGFINGAYISSAANEPAVRAAHKFFNYLLGPVFGERIGSQGRYATVTTAGQENLPQDIKEEIFLAYIDQLADLRIGFMIPPRNPDTGKLNYDEWVRVWSEVKAT